MPNTRRHFLKTAATTACSTLTLTTLPRALARHAQAVTNRPTTKAAPPHLQNHQRLYNESPLDAAKQWFRKAKLGLGLHWSLGSIISEGMEDERLTLHEYNALRSALTEQDWRNIRDKFTAENFDADLITDLAVDMGGHYVNFTTRHAGALFMWDTDFTNFNSVNSPGGRDFVAELAEQCHRKKLGLCLYIGGSFSLQRHPDELFNRRDGYLGELLRNYGPIANIWFDGISAYYASPERYPHLREIYRRIHDLQPHCLISFKQGTGHEDFVTCEGQWTPLNPKNDGPIAKCCWRKNLDRGCPGEIFSRIQVAPRHYFNIAGSENMTPDQLSICLANARAHDANMLLDVGPRFDGSIRRDQIEVLREFGANLRRDGYPAPEPRDKKLWKSWHGRTGDKIRPASPSHVHQRIRRLVDVQRKLIAQVGIAGNGPEIAVEGGDQHWLVGRLGACPARDHDPEHAGSTDS